MLTKHYKFIVIFRSDERVTASMDKSHSEPVYSTIWTASKTGMEIMTTSEAVFGLHFKKV